MRFNDYTILELTLSVRDCKANPSSYDREARETLRRVCRLRISDISCEVFLKRFEHPTDRNMAEQAYAEVASFAKPAGYTSGVWA